jgi:hypothetical protein
MKLPITIKFNNGEEATYVVNPPDWAKWELKTGKTIRQNDEIGMNDLMFLAYTSMSRTSGAKQLKSFETWILSVDDIEVGEVDPKATQPEA